MSCSSSSSSSSSLNNLFLLFNSIEAMRDPEMEEVDELVGKTQSTLEALGADGIAAPYRDLVLNFFSLAPLMPKKIKLEVTSLSYLNSTLKSEINALVASILNASRGNFKRFPLAVVIKIFSDLSNKDLGSLAAASHGCKHVAYSDGVWKGQVSAFGLTLQEVAEAGSSRGAVKAAYMNFYRAFYKFLSNCEQRVQRSSRELVELNDERTLSQPAFLQKFRNKLATSYEFRMRKYVNFDESNLTVIPGWIWPFFPKLEKLSLAGNRIKTLPTQIFDLNLRILNCSGNQLECLPSPTLKPSLREFFLKDNAFSSVPSCITSIAEKTFVSLSSNPLPEAEIKKLREMRPDLEVECFSSTIDLETQERSEGYDPLERQLPPYAFLE